MAPSKTTEKGSTTKNSKQSSVALSKKAVKPALSSETITLSDDDSSSEDSDDSDAPRTKVTSISTEKAAKKRKIDVAQDERLPKVNGNAKTNGKKKVQESADSKSSDNSSSSDESDAPRENGKASSGSTTSSESESESGSDSDSKSQEEGEESDDGMILDTPPKLRAEAIRPSSKSKTVESRAVDDWTPPNGFERISLSPANSNLLTTLTSSSLTGKQLWHITIPEDVDISSLHTLDPSVIDSGAAAFTSRDSSTYTFRTSRKRDLEGKLVLVPDSKSNEFTSVKAPIAKSLELRQLMPGAGTDIRHDEGDDEEWTLDPTKLVAQRTYEKVPPPRQREGLRVMNVPIGVVAAKEAPTFERPRSVKKKTVEADEVVREEEEHKETPEERAARKAEKARRKELKAQKKAAKAGR